MPGHYAVTHFLALDTRPISSQTGYVGIVAAANWLYVNRALPALLAANPSAGLDVTSRLRYTYFLANNSCHHTHRCNITAAHARHGRTHGRHQFGENSSVHEAHPAWVAINLIFRTLSSMRPDDICIIADTDVYFDSSQLPMTTLQRSFSPRLQLFVNGTKDIALMRDGSYWRKVPQPLRLARG